MLSNGNANDTFFRPASATFARPARHIGFKRWIAALPLIAVAAFTFNGAAPAETTGSDDVPVEAAQAEGRWSMSNARALLEMVEKSAEEGLNPADYQVDALRAAVAAKQKGPALDMLATASALRLAHDFADGRIENKAAFDWYIAPPADPNTLSSNLDQALDDGKLERWLRSLLPDNDQYRALKAAYASAKGDEALRGQLRANMERWRWMPRDLGERYLYVNVPTYRLELMNDGVEEASYNVVVGSPKTPTPQLALHAQSVVANPSWTVPPSVLKEGAPRGRGFTWIRKAGGGYSIRQAPGPNNALGRIKIDMPNEHAIYLHDTPNKAAFGRENRALSHGCVRVQNIQDLAALLHDGGDLDEALADPRTTKTLQLQKSVPVYIVYFTAQADADGTVRYVGDPYGRDRKLLDQLGGPGGGSAVRMAAR